MIYRIVIKYLGCLFVLSSIGCIPLPFPYTARVQPSFKGMIYSEGVPLFGVRVSSVDCDFDQDIKTVHDGTFVVPEKKDWKFPFFLPLAAVQPGFDYSQSCDLRFEKEGFVSLVVKANFFKSFAGWKFVLPKTQDKLILQAVTLEPLRR